MYPEWCTQDRKPGNTVLCTVRQGKEDSTRNSKNKSLLLMQKQILNTSKKKREISWCKWFFSNTSINMHIKNYVLEYLL